MHVRSICVLAVRGMKMCPFFLYIENNNEHVILGPPKRQDKKNTPGERRKEDTDRGLEK